MRWLLRLFKSDHSQNRQTASRLSSGTNTDEFVAELQEQQAKAAAAASVDGVHYTAHVERVKQLKRERRHDEAIELLRKLVEATEREAKVAGWDVAPGYYEQLAIVYRKERRYEDEVAILERYAPQVKAPGAKPAKLAERLEKARQLLERKRA